MMAPMRLKKLDLSYSNLQTVKPDILARTVCLLETAIVRGCSLTFTQINAIAWKIMGWDEDWFCLKHLDLAENNNLRQADFQLVGIALTKIERVHIKEYDPQPYYTSKLSRFLINGINMDEDSQIRQLEL